MWNHQESIEISASAEQIWKLFEDVNSWGAWNPGVESINLHGPFAGGTTFTMQPPGREAMTSKLLDVRPGESFTDETIVDGTRVLVAHKLEALESGGTRVTFATEITGPDADQFGPMVTSDFPDVLSSLKQLAERCSNGSP